MRLTIVPEDFAVYVDGVFKGNLDFSQCDIPSNVHALQWFGDKGWIEFKEESDPFLPKPQNEVIDVLPAWAVKCHQQWSTI